MSNLESMKCPECDAQLYFSDDQDFCYCSHCGTQVFKSNPNKKTFTYRKIDEAEIEKLRYKKEKDRQNREEKQREFYNNLLYAVILFILIFVSILFFGHWLVSCSNEYAEQQEIITQQKANEETEKKSQGMFKISNSYTNYIGRNYQIVYAEFEAMGFTNIELIDLNDVWFGSKDKDMVESVSINGDSRFYYDDWFLPSDKVIISYH